MISIYLFISFLIIESNPSCEKIYQEFLSNYSQIGQYEKGHAYSLNLRITSYLNHSRTGEKTFSQELQSYVYEDGYYLSTDQIINAGSKGQMTTLVPVANKIIISKYDNNQLPELLDAQKRHLHLFTNNSEFSCEIVEKTGENLIKIEVKFDKPQNLQQQFIKEADFFLSESDYSLLKSEFKFLEGNQISKQIIEYRNYDSSYPISKVPKPDFPFDNRGKLKKKYSSFQVVEQ